MTNEELEELDMAVHTAKLIAERLQRRDALVTPMQDVAIGALTRAVELLAGERARESRPMALVSTEEMGRNWDALQARLSRSVPTTKAETVELAQGAKEAAMGTYARAGFDDGLVERLAVAAYGTFFDKLEDPKPWTELSLITKARWELSVRAILSELAGMPCVLPTEGEIHAMLSRGCGHTHHAEMDAVAEMLRVRIAPVIAAKDAQIARLKALLDDSAAFDSDLATENRKLQSRLAELEKRLTEQTSRESELHVMLAAHGLPTEPKALARELAQRDTPVDADGKTPGQVLGIALESAPDSMSCGDAQEYAAKAVLRAFGSEATLSRLRARVPNMPGRRLVDDPEWMFTATEVIAAIDDELAKLGWQTKARVGRLESTTK